MPRSARSAALFDRQMRPSSRKRVKAGQRLSMQSIALALSAWRDSLGRSSRSPRSRSTMSGALNSCRTARRRSVLWPLIARSISNSASMRRTASRASGEITLAGLPCALRRALAARSARTKNGRRACAQQVASRSAPAGGRPGTACCSRHRHRPGGSRHNRPDAGPDAHRCDRANSRTSPPADRAANGRSSRT